MGSRSRACGSRSAALAAALAGVAATVLPCAAARGPQDAAAPAAARALATRYEPGTSLRVQVELGLELGDRDLWILVDGAEPERASGGSLRQGREVRRLAWVDRWLAADEPDGLHVTRTFERLDATTSARLGIAENSGELRSPLASRAIEFVRAPGGELERRVLGDPLPPGSPDPAALLEGREPTLALDALLPPEAVAPGSVWTLSDSQLRHALAPLVRDQLTFPLATPQPQGAVPMTAYVYIPARLMQALHWAGEAKLAPVPVRWHDAECAAIELRVQAQLEVTEGTAPGRAEVSGEGRLLFDLAAGRPVLLTLEGSVEADRTHAAQDPADPTRRRVKSRGQFDLTIEVFAGPQPAEER